MEFLKKERYFHIVLFHDLLKSGVKTDNFSIWNFAIIKGLAKIYLALGKAILDFWAFLDTILNVGIKREAFTHSLFDLTPRAPTSPYLL